MKQITTPKLVRRNYVSKMVSRLQRIFLFPLSFCFVLTIVFTSPLFTQGVLAQSNVKIEGYVYDQENGHHLSGAEVRIANSSYRTITNSSGFFFFEKLPIVPFERLDVRACVAAESAFREMNYIGSGFAGST